MTKRLPQPKASKASLNSDFSEDEEDEFLSEGMYSRTKISRRDLEEHRADRMSFHATVFESNKLLESEWEDCSLTDVCFHKCDFANATWLKPSVTRVEFSESRLLGFQTFQGTLTDVQFKNCQLQNTSFDFSRMNRVLFVNCDLTESSFAEAQLRNVTFKNCKLHDVSFLHSSLSTVDIRGSEIDNWKIDSPEDLEGAVVDPEHAIYFVTFLGLRFHL